MHGVAQFQSLGNETIQLYDNTTSPRIWDSFRPRAFDAVSAWADTARMGHKYSPKEIPRRSITSMAYFDLVYPGYWADHYHHCSGTRGEILMASIFPNQSLEQTPLGLLVCMGLPCMVSLSSGR